MFIKEYLEQERISVKSAAMTLGIHPVHLHYICHRKRWASYHLCKDIERFSNGEVTIDDMLKDKPEPTVCQTCGHKYTYTVNQDRFELPDPAKLKKQKNVEK